MSVKYCNALKDPSHTEEGFEAEEAITISKLFQKAVATCPNHPALRYKIDTIWEELSYSQYYNKCLETARAYIEVSA